MLTGPVAEVRAMAVNESGAVQAGVFVRFHPSQSEAGLLMYSESLADGDAEESRSTLFRLKSAAGWRRKAWRSIQTIYQHLRRELPGVGSRVGQLHFCGDQAYVIGQVRGG